MRKTSIFTSTLKQGLIMGLGFCAYTTLMWLTKFDTTYLRFGQYLDIAIIVLPVVVILWAIRQEHQISPLTILQRIKIAVFVGAVSYLVYEPFLYTYHHFINPDWYNAVLALKESELKEANVPANKIAETLQKMKESNAAQSGMFRPATFIPSVFIIPTLIPIVSLVFIKRKGKV